MAQPDGIIHPVFVTPSSSTISQSDTIDVTITFDHTATSNTTVNLSSSNSALIKVPATATLTTGHDSLTFHTLSPSIAHALRSSNVTLTASCNGGSADAVVTVN